MNDLKNYLDDTWVINAHVWAKGNDSIKASQVHQKDWPCYCHSMESIVLAPHFFDTALQGYSIACEYFGEPARMYSMNAFWTNPASTQYRDTHDWHRDGDDRQQLVIFMYGTDVLNVAAGAHRYQRGTHTNRADHSYDYDFRNPPEDKVVETILGPAGTMFFSDTWGLHMGQRPDRRRLLCWARWGVSQKPESYIWDKLSPVDRTRLGDHYPTDPKIQKAIELVVS